MKILQVDAFTNEPFRGNPAGVCVLEGEVSPEWMQNMAAEMNLAETAYISPARDGVFGLRWFTPVTEVPLCGHATLASAFTLFSTGVVPVNEAIKFSTKSGILTCRSVDGWIVMDLPAAPPKTTMALDVLEKIIGDRIVYIGLAKEFMIVEVISAEKLRTAKINPGALLANDVPELIVTAQCNDGKYDFISRMFAPRVGIPEDPVTGAAHCVLAPYWAKRLEKTEFFAHQASKRGGDLRVALKGDRVELAGQAVTVFEGELSAPASP